MVHRFGKRNLNKIGEFFFFDIEGSPLWISLKIAKSKNSHYGSKIEKNSVYGDLYVSIFI